MAETKSDPILFAKTYPVKHPDFTKLHTIVLQHSKEVGEIIPRTLSFLDGDRQEIARYVYNDLSGAIQSLTIYEDVLIWDSSRLQKMRPLTEEDRTTQRLYSISVSNN